MEEVGEIFGGASLASAPVTWFLSQVYSPLHRISIDRIFDFAKWFSVSALSCSP